MKRILVAQLLVAALAFASAHAVAQMSRPVRGEFVGLEGHTLHLRTATGQSVDVKLADDARVSLFTPEPLDAIKQGMFVGATAKPGPNGTLVASEVHIFPEALRGTGEGHHPMRTNPGSTMTNATVSRVSDREASKGRSMTSATVASVDDGGNGRLMHMTYKGGEQDIFVPAGTPVVLYERGDLASLVPGAHVLVNVTTDPDGTLATSRVSVGKNGSDPPI